MEFAREAVQRRCPGSLQGRNEGEGYAKIGKHLAAISSPLPEKLRNRDVIEDIRRATREKYCVPIKEFRERMIEEHHVSVKDMRELDLL